MPKAKIRPGPLCRATVSHCDPFTYKHSDMHITKTTTTLLIAFFTAFLAISACKKSTTSCNNPTAAIILNRGPVSGDGCGWVVRIDTVDYHPVSLASGYQTDSLRVNVSYTLDTSHFYCGLLPTAMPVISVSCIERR